MHCVRAAKGGRLESIWYVATWADPIVGHFIIPLFARVLSKEESVLRLIGVEDPSVNRRVESISSTSFVALEEENAVLVASAGFIDVFDMRSGAEKCKMPIKLQCVSQTESMLSSCVVFCSNLDSKVLAAVCSTRIARALCNQ